MIDRNERWAGDSIKVQWMIGQPTMFVQGFGNALDKSEHDWKMTWKVRFPFGPIGSAVFDGIWGEDHIPAEKFPVDPGDDLRMYHLGVTYQLDRYPPENSAAYTARLETAWETHANGGTPNEIINQLHLYGWTDVFILEEDKYKLLPDGCEYYWAFKLVFPKGDNSNSLYPAGMKLGVTWVLGQSYLALGNKSLDDIKRTIIDPVLKWRQCFDCFLGIVFAFGESLSLLGINTGLGPSAPESWFLGADETQSFVCIPVQERRALGKYFILGQTIDTGIMVQ